MEKKDEREGIPLCEKCGKEIEWCEEGTWWNEQWTEQKGKFLNVVHKKRNMTHWKHKNGGLFDNVSGCDDPTPRNVKTTLVQCIKCDKMFDFTKEGSKWYDRNTDRLMARCGNCEGSR